MSIPPSLCLVGDLFISDRQVTSETLRERFDCAVERIRLYDWLKSQDGAGLFELSDFFHVRK